jgi:hypothetical protein
LRWACAGRRYTKNNFYGYKISAVLAGLSLSWYEEVRFRRGK